MRDPLNIVSNCLQPLTFDDVLISPQFSNIKSRKDVDLTTTISDLTLKLPIFSAPMDTVSGPEMNEALYDHGAMGCLHRFMSIEENVKQFYESDRKAVVSVGLNDWERVEALYADGANKFLLDVANGAQMQVVEWVKQFRAKYKNEWLMVGNFASYNTITDFVVALNENAHYVDAWRVGIGPGAACTTRIKTGIGVPQLSAIIDCARTGYDIVADGGIKNAGDVAKALAAGAKAVMLGSMLAGTAESPGDLISRPSKKQPLSCDMLMMDHFKSYRGSASKESYEAQGKSQDYISAEGESFLVPYKGPVKDVLKDIEGGLRSSFTYVGAKNLNEFQEKAIFVKITNNGMKESIAHGKKE